MRKSLFLTVAACLFFAATTFSQTAISIDEKSIVVVGDNDRLRVGFNLDAADQAPVDLYFELVDSMDYVYSTAVARVDQRRDLTVTLPLKGRNSIEKLLWDRLRFTASANGKSVTGIVSLSQVMPDLFELKAVARSYAYAGMSMPVSVRAVHPITGAVAANVIIEAEMTLEPNANVRDVKFKQTAKTDAEGFATLRFQVPENFRFLGQSSGSVKILGLRDGLAASAETSFNTYENQPMLIYMLDKPLYQPGQKLQFRVLAMRRDDVGENLSVLPASELSFTIRDENEVVLASVKTKTSAYGVASGEWTIPSNAKLGNYSIVAGGNEVGRGYSRRDFKVSRYELPTFVVLTKSDKPFYLTADKTAEVTVKAMYLFGKPVAAGKVRIVRESSRRWNYNNQRWDVLEESAVEGEVDSSGKFVAKLDLSEGYSGTRGAFWDGYADLNFAAYFTDASTNRTEARRFDIRLTDQPIHVRAYFEGDSYRGLSPRVPVSTRLTVTTADGEDCVCDVEVAGRYSDEPESAKRTLLKTRTDAGSQTVFDLPLPPRDMSSQVSLLVSFTAMDKTGRIGHEEKTLTLVPDRKSLLLRTEKMLYKAGEPLRLSVFSSEDDKPVVLDVSSGGKSLVHRIIRPNGGRAEVEIPYQPEFRKRVVASVFLQEPSDYSYMQQPIGAVATVVYPRSSALNVSARTARSVYRPGSDGSLDFKVSDRNRQSQQSALGVVVLDRAVIERAESEPNGWSSGILDSFTGMFAKRSWDDVGSGNFTPEMQREARSTIGSGFLQFRMLDDRINRQLAVVFADRIRSQFQSVGDYLRDYFRRTNDYPTDEESLTRILAKGGIDFTKFRDPWGQKYRVSSRVEQTMENLTIVSDGADKTPDNLKSTAPRDDLNVFSLGFEYFRETGLKLSKAVTDYQTKTGKFVRDYETLVTAATAADLNIDALRDKWGEKYKFKFGVDGRHYVIVVESSGPDRRADTDDTRGDDFICLRQMSDFFKPEENKIDAALQKFIAKTNAFPRDETQFNEALKADGLDFDALRDGWNRPLFVTYETKDFYTDDVVIDEIVAADGSKKTVLKVTPVTQKFGVFKIRSLGENGIRDKEEWPDPTFSMFSAVISQQRVEDKKPGKVIPVASMKNGNGAIYGTIRHIYGNFIAGAAVTARRDDSREQWSAKTGPDGVYTIADLPPGRYRLEIMSAGFSKTEVLDVNVAPQDVAIVNVRISPGSSDSVVTVSNASVLVNTAIETADAAMGNVFTARQIVELPVNGRRFMDLLALQPGITREGYVAGGRSDQAMIELTADEIKSVDKPQTSTPRLREYFPETLLWQPEIVTDKNGKATVKFRLGDNITTWNVYAVASDAKGRVGVTTTEFKTFQPFFVDLDPPKILTAGDEIYLPAQVRNYSQTAKKVDVSMAKNDWSELLDAGRQTIDVGSNATANAVFGFRASRPVTDGKQQVTALAGTDSDAVEKPLTVRPDGEEIVRTESLVFASNAVLDLDFPDNAISNTQSGELRVYPNLFSHIADSIEGLLRRPYGCGEQTISSTYPNLMILRFGKKFGANLSPALETSAKRYLKTGYDRLAGYQAADGGFTYWGGNDESDIALTAYALRFMTDAKGFVDSDDAALAKAREYLVKKQEPNGSFVPRYKGQSADTVPDMRQTWMTTTYVARTLAKLKSAGASSKETDDVLAKALAFLKLQNETTFEPYTLALYGLAASDAGFADDARKAAEKLRANAISEGPNVYWNLETNTPFFGWGTAGRVETTALVVQFLMKVDPNDELAGRATSFLLKNKDRFGVWYSTQTTINVLDAFLGAISSVSPQTVTVTVNGEKLAPFTIAADRVEPIVIDLRDKLKTRNRIAIAAGGGQLMAQLVGTHYVGWKDAPSTSQNQTESRLLALDYSCDKTSAKIMETVTCSVAAERIGFRGYGMLLAEIGIPPGAEVSREALDKLLRNDWSVGHYDVLPDRIVFYLWAKPGGTKFNFEFKPRYAIKAKTPASFVYDYYNEEAKATVAPLTFEVAR